MQNLKRQYYLDWIRVIAIIIVFLFHCARFFDKDDWHIKNTVTSPLASLFTFMLAEWIMPMFFFISGASTWFALQFKPANKFITDRITRIFLPLLFGIIFLSPHQVYLERVSHHQFTGNLIQFLPHYFTGWYGLGGNFAWMGLHLWYLLLLFVFTMITLPLFLLIKKNKYRQLALLNPGISLGFFVLLIAIPGLLLIPEGLINGRMWGGWSIFEHLCFFITGFLAFTNAEIISFVRRYRFILLSVTLLITALNLYFYWNSIWFSFGSVNYDLKILLRSFVGFGWIFSLIGFAEKNLNFTNEKLKFGSEAVLPFYILHQPVIVLIGYFIVQIDTPVIFKYSVIVFLSFAVVMLLYQFVVRKSNLLRFLFGMGNLRKTGLNISSSTRLVEK